LALQIKVRAIYASEASRQNPALGIPVTDQLRQTLKNLLRRKKYFVPILYQIPAFGAFDDFSDFLESKSCETSKSCQVPPVVRIHAGEPHSKCIPVHLTAVGSYFSEEQ
jgi:hypothetical protein